MAFNGRVEVRSSFAYTDAATATRNTTGTSTIDRTSDYEVGTGANQATIAYSEQRTSASPVTYDFNNSSLEDNVGRAVAFTGIAMIIISNLSTAAAPATMTVGDGASNPLIPFGVAGDVVQVGPGGVLVLEWPVTKLVVSGTKKTLLVTPSASCQWEIQVVGAA